MLLEDKAEAIIHDLLKMGLLAILIPVSNARHNHVSLHLREKPLDTVDVGAVLRKKYAEMVDDLRCVYKCPELKPLFIEETAGFYNGFRPVAPRVGHHHFAPVSKSLQLRTELLHLFLSSSSSKTPKPSAN